jgi:ribonuclease P protein subunit POP4
MSPISPNNLVRHELIGLRTKVVESSNLNHQSISGVVINESLKTLVIETENNEKMIPKNDSIFLFSLPTGQVQVDGSILYGRPEDRVKKKIKRRW